MAGETPTVVTEYSRNSNSLYFDLQPKRRKYGIAFVRRVSSDMFLDIDRRDGVILGIEVLNPLETIFELVNPLSLTEGRYMKKTGKVALGRVRDVVNKLVPYASNDQEREAANFITRKLSIY